jgi:hypothetical protein
LHDFHMDHVHNASAVLLWENSATSRADLELAIGCSENGPIVQTHEAPGLEGATTMGPQRRELQTALPHSVGVFNVGWLAYLDSKPLCGAVWVGPVRDLHVAGTATVALTVYFQTNSQLPEVVAVA